MILTTFFFFFFFLKGPVPIWLPGKEGKRNVKIGDKMTCVVRVGYTWFVHNSTSVITRNVNIRGSSFMAITEFDGGGANIYDDVNVIRRKKKESGKRGSGPIPLVACNADVFHSSGCQHGPHVMNSEYSYAFDDYVNVHTRAQISVGLWEEVEEVGEVEGEVEEVELLIADPRLRRDDGLDDDGPYGVVETLTNLRPGMHLLLSNPHTLHLEMPPLQVVRAERVVIGNNAIVRAQSALDDLSANVTYVPHYNFMDATYNETNGNNTTSILRSRVWRVRVVLPSSSPSSSSTNARTKARTDARNKRHIRNQLNATYLCEIQEWNNSNAVVTGNIFHSSIDGVRWKSSNGQFVNNTWWNPLSNSKTGLEITPLRSFMEGPFRITNVTVRSNVFIGKENYFF